MQRILALRATSRGMISGDLRLLLIENIPKAPAACSQAVANVSVQKTSPGGAVAVQFCERSCR
mgnify:CR=1 FL=1